MRKFLLGFLMLAAATTAYAEPGGNAKKPAPAPAATKTPTKTPDVAAMHTSDCAKARAQNKTCVLDMTGESIDGKPVLPDGSSVNVVTMGKDASLIHYRKDFIVEILKSAEDL